tara:strand:- start:7916 stop:8173 length:258 start_codon:yes stop_codon:yes gene_type:complete
MPQTTSMQKEVTAILDRSLFNKAESKIMQEITEMTKSLLSTFKFQMIYNARVSEKTETKTLQLVKEYRKEKKLHKNYFKDLFPSR